MSHGNTVDMHGSPYGMTEYSKWPDVSYIMASKHSSRVQLLKPRVAYKHGCKNYNIQKSSQMLSCSHPPYHWLYTAGLVYTVLQHYKGTLTPLHCKVNAQCFIPVDTKPFSSPSCFQIIIPFLGIWFILYLYIYVTFRKGDEDLFTPIPFLQNVSVISLIIYSYLIMSRWPT